MVMCGQAASAMQRGRQQEMAMLHSQKETWQQMPAPRQTAAAILSVLPRVHRWRQATHMCKMLVRLVVGGQQ